MDKPSIRNKNNSLITFGTILWMIAGISFFLALLFSIGLFQSLGNSSEFLNVRLVILVLLMGIFNATSISGTILIVSNKKND